MKALQIDIHVDDDPEPTMAVMLRGGIAVRAGGERLNCFSNEDELSRIQDWNPEYAGEHILEDMRSLIKCALALRAGEIDVYERRRVRLVESPGAIVVARLSADALRIAFQADSWYDQEEHFPPPHAALGVAVALEEFCAELLDCADRLIAAAEEFGVAEQSDLRTFRETVEELRALE